jgi:hypothetical protein
MPTVVLDTEVCRYLAAFSIAAVTVQGDRITAYHRARDIPGTVDWIGWLRAADAERVVRRAQAFGKITDAANAVLAAARDLGVGLTGHSDLLIRVKAATTRIASQTEAARVNGHLKAFNQQFKARRLRAAAEGKTFMSYTAALRRLRGELATKAAGRSGAVTQSETAGLFAAVFGEN